MEIRATAEVVVNLQFSIDVTLKDLLAESGIEEFTERARNTLEEQIRPLLALLPNGPDPDTNKPEPATVTEKPSETVQSRR